MKAKFVIIFVVAAVVIAKANTIEERRHNRHSELLKPETNAIDHGPTTSHKSGLLGHRGEQHWANAAAGGKKKKMRKNKKKAHHSSDGVHHDALDDIRLQDLSYKGQHHEKKNRKGSKGLRNKAKHSKAYLKKLKQWKAKMMSKKQHRNKQPSNKNMQP